MKKITLAVCLIGMNWMMGQTHFRLAPFASDFHFSSQQTLDFVTLDPSKAPSAAQVAGFINENVLNNSATKVAVLKSENDNLGYTHTRYVLQYNGTEVARRQIISHVKDGKLISLNGEMYEPKTPSNNLSLSEAVALSNALKHVGAERYMWENKAEEAHMRQVLEDPNFTYYPKGEQIIFEKDGKSLYTWRFNIYAESPLSRAYVFVDASNGQVVETENLICSANVTNTVVTKYSGTQTVTADFNGSIYQFKETARGLGIETYNMQATTNYNTAVSYTNTVSNWTIVNNTQGGRDAHWGAEKTYDYYWFIHNRNSINNNGFKLISYCRYGTNYVNAFWDGQRMTYGDGSTSSGYGVFTALDVCGHEITHGLTSNTGNLTYQNESGALNEGWSDIFGVSIENYGRPSNWNWKIGEDVVAGGMRNMANPNQFGDPDCYLGTNWYAGTQDNGGVHTNSGVANFWFYLLTTGGIGTNDFNNTYTVTGIGITDAAKIAFRGMTVYFTPSTNYTNARLLTVQSAKDLFGNCSTQMIATMNAWYACGVGTAYNPSTVGVDYKPSNTNYCTLPATVTFSNLTVNGSNYIWDFGDGTTSTATNAVKTYTAPGNYTIKLKATGCNNLVDSTTKFSQIAINPVTTPQVTDYYGCSSYGATLTALGSGTMNWYPNMTSTTAIGTGATWVTPPLGSSATFYVASQGGGGQFAGGELAPVNGGYLNNNTHWLSFDVNQNCTLNTIDIDAQFAGNRTIVIRNSANTLVYSLTTYLNVGINTVIINQALTTGMGYKMMLNGGSSAMYRTTTGVNFPYALGNALNITGSSVAGSYIWFYNWNITVPGCVSSKVAVNANITQGPVVTATSPVSTMCKDDQVNMIGSPAGGVFTGGNFNGSTFAPVSSGTYNIVYTYTDNTSGCPGYDTSIVMAVEECEGLAEANQGQLKVFPNPATDIIQISGVLGNGTMNVIDATGRLVATLLVSEAKQISVADLAKGVYILQFYNSDGILTNTTRFVKE
jgi:Zn-dependent metalloprotease